MTAVVAAVLWDMDGTIVDTEPYFLDAAEQLVGADGGRWTQQVREDLVGASLWAIAQAVIDSGSRRTAADIVHEILDGVLRSVRASIPWRPGARELLGELRRHQVPTALVTMSFRSVAEEIVRAIPFDAFDVIVTGDEVVNGKPHPEAYLRAAGLLGVDVRDCTVIEDSLPGVCAGVAAGATVIAVPCYADLPEGGYEVWKSLEGRGIGDLLRARSSPS